jgi:glycosyltransferase involved in cell wall biosynthesis
MRLVTTVHGWVDQHWKAPLYDRLDRWSLKHYERVICVSDDLRKLCEQSGVPAERLRLIENGIDVEAFQRRHSPHEARQKLGWGPENFYVGAVGRLSAEKGFDLLIDAVHELHVGFPKLRLVIAGDGPLRNALEQQIARRNLKDVVQLLGFCEDVPAMLEALDVFALSSRREGLPNVVLEAMAMKAANCGDRDCRSPESDRR